MHKLGSSLRGKLQSKMRKWEEAPLPWIPSAPFALDLSPLPLPSCLWPPLTHLGLFSIWAVPLACSEDNPQDHALRTPLILSAPPLSQACVALGPSITGSPQWGEETAAWSSGHSKSGGVGRNTEWSSSIRVRLGEALAQAWKAGQREGWNSIPRGGTEYAKTLGLSRLTGTESL